MWKQTATACGRNNGSHGAGERPPRSRMCASGWEPCANTRRDGCESFVLDMGMLPGLGGPRERRCGVGRVEAQRAAAGAPGGGPSISTRRWNHGFRAGPALSGAEDGNLDAICSAHTLRRVKDEQGSIGKSDASAIIAASTPSVPIARLYPNLA